MHTVTESTMLSRPGRVPAVPGYGMHRSKNGRIERKRKPPKLPRKLVRGQGYITDHGFGYYVGTSAAGSRLFCYGQLADFYRLCNAFDQVERSKANRAILAMLNAKSDESETHHADTTVADDDDLAGDVGEAADNQLN